MPGIIYLQKNHILFEAQNNITEICNPLFNLLTLRYFHFRRTFQDGSYFVLTTYSNWSLYFIKNRVPIKTPFVGQFFNSKSYFSLWQGNIPDKTLSVAKNCYGIKSALAIVERNETYFDSYSFGSKGNNITSYNNYINNIDLFLKFIPFFHEKASPLIEKAKKQIFVPQKSLKDINLKKILGSNACIEKENFIKTISLENLVFKTKLGLITLTKREAECLYYLSHGKNRKEIGNLINLSPRTVDTHFEKAKNKLGCFTSSELIDIWWKNYPII